MAEKKVLMTYEGIKELEDELATLKGKTRMEVSDRLKSAISFGDITENSEYDEAKNEQAQVEARIMFLENLLMNVEVIDSDNIDTTNVTVGCRVKILDLEYDEEEIYQVVGPTEANPFNMRISYESPIGKAILGRKAGDVVEFTSPSGPVKVKILDIME
ncbi:MAG TPA: transcription elongation factor GreA [Clostridia bacterium]|jgi:transcription elongation factor GreA|nr:MAG: Transcription elongation factor GreA [Firmicutes bacterium ADurb.Bin146]HOD93350.1 transcription elongation factor GreA [Clostridia bacterium]HQM39606.1 transcription elongation factor GreA [Clostridia bacterium]